MDPLPQDPEVAEEPSHDHDEEIEEVRRLVLDPRFKREKEAVEKVWAMVSRPPSQWDRQKIIDILLARAQEGLPDSTARDLISELIRFFPFKNEEIEEIRRLISELHSDLGQEEIEKIWIIVSKPPARWNRQQISDIITDIYKERIYEEDIPSRAISSLNKLTGIFPGEAVKLLIHGHPLRRRYGYYKCSACPLREERSGRYYKCLRFYTCRVIYCVDCAESPGNINPTCHPKPTLTLKELPDEDIERSCALCGDDIYIKRPFYHCSTCHLCMHPSCARLPVEMNVDSRKIHAHTLTVLPRCVHFICNACGLAGAGCPYICLPCNFMVHKYCTSLPGLIKIMHHQHRLSLTYSPPPGELSCGVCSRVIDNSYGAYSCEKGCNYTVHSRCVLKKGVWDRKDLEGEPEETYNETKGSEPLFERIDDKVICHLSHKEHNLRLSKDNGVYDESKLCHVCVLPIQSSCFYSCMECDDFILHEICANLPREKQHPLHFHPLTLDSNIDALHVNDGFKGFFECSACVRWCNGFQYRCSENCDFKVDVHCASIIDGGLHPYHPHPLVTSFEAKGRDCEVCGISISDMKLKCNNCSGFFVCFRCATIPQELRYKFDDHSLKLCYGEDKDDPYWCEICENTLNPKGAWFYACNDCGITVHVLCVFGNLSYMRPDQSVEFRNLRFDIVSNNRPFRPMCEKCGSHCQQASYFKGNGICFCSSPFLYWRHI